MTLAERIIQARHHAGLTQKELAKRTELSQQAVSMLETGKQKATTEIVTIAVVCGVRPEWLALEQGEMLNIPMVNIDNDKKLQQLLLLARELPEYGKDKAIQELADLAQFIRTAAQANQTAQEK